MGSAPSAAGEITSTVSGVTDMREHMNWLHDELSNTTVAERVEMYRKFAGEDFHAQYETARDRVKRVVKLGGFVNSAPTFFDQPKVINGASDLMVEVFGEAGKHARSAVGVPSLPLGVAVEVDAILAVRGA